MALLTLACGCRPAPATPRGPLQLRLGRPDGPRGLVRVWPGAQVETRTGKALGWDALLDRLAAARVVFVGEQHDHPGHHRVQARILAGLARRGGLLVGLEMFQRGTVQQALDDWTAGKLDEASFLKNAQWKKQWGYDFGAYRPVFALAKQHRLPLVALNVLIDIARAVGRRGLQALDPALRRTLPPLHLDAPRHRKLFRALIGLALRPQKKRRAARKHGHHAHHGFLDRLFTAQVVRDEVMAATIASRLDAAGPRSRMVVLVGNGHLLYHTGVNARLQRRQPRLRQATVVCVSSGPQGRKVSRGVADFLVGTPNKMP